jgi:hypothetical protein
MVLAEVMIASAVTAIDHGKLLLSVGFTSRRASFVFVRPETGGYHPYHYGSSVAAADRHHNRQVAITLLDHVAEVDADPKVDAAHGRQPSVAFGHPVLHLDSAAHGIDDASELDENAVARPLDDTAVM